MSCAVHLRPKGIHAREQGDKELERKWRRKIASRKDFRMLEIVVELTIFLIAIKGSLFENSRFFFFSLSFAPAEMGSPITPITPPFHGDMPAGRSHLEREHERVHLRTPSRKRPHLCRIARSIAGTEAHAEPPWASGQAGGFDLQERSVSLKKTVTFPESVGEFLSRKTMAAAKV
jgi:hypothetical protein